MAAMLPAVRLTNCDKKHRQVLWPEAPGWMRHVCAGESIVISKIEAEQHKLIIDCLVDEQRLRIEPDDDLELWLH
jgi:hypothetical protein